MIEEFLFSETGDAVAEITKVVVNEPEITKEDVANAAVDNAHVIAEEVDKAVKEHTGEPMTDEKFNEVVETVAQCIYTGVMSELAVAQSTYAMEELFN